MTVVAVRSVPRCQKYCIVRGKGTRYQRSSKYQESNSHESSGVPLISLRDLAETPQLAMALFFKSIRPSEQQNVISMPRLTCANTSDATTKPTINADCSRPSSKLLILKSPWIPRPLELLDGLCSDKDSEFLSMVWSWKCPSKGGGENKSFWCDFPLFPLTPSLAITPLSMYVSMLISTKNASRPHCIHSYLCVHFFFEFWRSWRYHWR